MPNRRVLLVSYLFPPAGGVGVQRALAYARYLPDSGAEVWVLAARNPSTPVMDRALVSEIPATAHMQRVSTPELPYQWRDRLWRMIARHGQQSKERPGDTRSGESTMSGGARLIRRLTSPDPQVVWTPWATRCAVKLIERHRIDTVLVTVPPFSALQLGVELKRRFPGLCIISDFRDEWLSFYLSLDPTNRHSLRAESERRERAAVEASSLVVAVTATQSADIRSRYPDQPAEKFICIPNGYDPAAFATFRPRSHGTEKIVVSFFGTVYRYNSPRSFLEAADRLPRELATRIETRFYGRIADDQDRLLVSRYGTVRIHGFMSYAAALRQLEETDFLLLPVDSATAHAGKLFDYLAMGKPILAPTPPQGEIARLLADTGAGWAADPKDPAAMDRMLLTALETVRVGGFAPNRAAIEAFARPRLVRQLCEELEKSCKAETCGASI
jgi:glycosyltransferase involved in cell wall biosynthesis